MTILVITTGGTIGAMPVRDPKRVPKMQVMPPDKRDFVREALEAKFPAYEARCVSLEPRDSKLVDDACRDDIANIIEAAPEKHILITHGSDALLKTADYLYRSVMERKGLRGKAIVFTGAMMPLTNGAESDGYKNLAFALDLLTHPDGAPAGVSIVLSDFEDPGGSGAWAPRLYPFAPGKYVKQFHPDDDRFCRIVPVS